MSFERTKGSITNLADGNIFADDLMDMLVCVTRDVYEANHVSNAADLQVRDQGMLLKKMYNLIKLIHVIYEGNREGIDQFSQRIREDYEKAVQALETREVALKAILDTVAQNEKTLEEVRKTAADTEAARGHLLELQTVCEDLQARIRQLNDPALDQLAQQKTELEQELQQRKQRMEELQAGLQGLRSALEQAENRAKALEEAAQEIREQHSAAQQQVADREAEKERLAADIVTLQEKLEAEKKRISDLPALRERVKVAYTEVHGQLTVMRNALNSVRSDAFLEANLFTASESGSLTVENYPDLAIAGKRIGSLEELDAWFGHMEARINGLLEVYSKTLEEMVKKAESITVRNEQE